MDERGCIVLDRIVVRTNADMTRVLEWANELHGLAVELPFLEGEIEFQEEEILLKFRDEGNGVVSFEMDMCQNYMAWGKEEPDWIKVASWRSNLESGEIMDIEVSGGGSRKSDILWLLAKDNTVWKCVAKFRAIMLFSAYYREEVQRSQVVVKRGGSGTGSAKRKAKKRSNRRPLTLRKYVIGSEMLSELPEPKGAWKGYAHSFGVRGHFRKMKNDKVIWVRPYTKKGRDEKRGDREYIL